jgi:uncharacterized membrane-anchored protein
MDIVNILNQIINLLGKALEYAPFLAAMGSFSLIGQFAKEICTKKRASTKSKYRPFWFWMRLTLPLHPLAAGLTLGLLDRSKGVSYYVTAAIVSVFLFDLVKRFTGYKVDLVDD